METMLRERGVETDFVWVEGETRLNTVLVVPGEGQSTITASSLRVSALHISELTSRYQDALREASCVVLGGSVPQGVPLEFYAGAIDQAHIHNIPVIFDSSGPSLLAGVKSRPDLIKPNLAELAELLGESPNSQVEAQQAAEKLHAELDTHVILTLGQSGAFAVFADHSYFIEPVSMAVVSSAGAGDGVLAGMALAYDRHESLEYGLRHGFALANAVLKTLATADFLLEDYQELLSQIIITPLHG